MRSIIPLLAAATLALAPFPTTCPSIAQTLPATEPEIRPPVASASLDKLLKDLASDDFKTRDAAQKQLSTTTWHDLALLKRHIAATTDEEVKARLQQRVQEIEEQVALNPPPISLDVKNANLQQLIEALNKATGIAFETFPPGGLPMQGGKTYTLTVKDQPFWEVFEQLSRQASLSLQSVGNLRLMQREPGLKNGVIVGAFAIFPLNILQSRNIDLQADPAHQIGEKQTVFSYVVAGDPRLNITQATMPTVSEIVDDLGNILYKPPEQQAAVQRMLASPMQRSYWQNSVVLNMPEKPGTRITVRGMAGFVVQVAEDRAEVANIEKKLGERISIGGQTVVISALNVTPERITLSASLERSSPPIVRAGAAGGPAIIDRPPGVNLRLIDATGKTVWTGIVQGGMGASTTNSGAVQPLKLQLSFPTKTKELVVPFELKDLVLP